MFDARSFNNWSLHIILVQLIFIRFFFDQSGSATVGVHPMMNTRIGQVICIFITFNDIQKFQIIACYQNRVITTFTKIFAMTIAQVSRWTAFFPPESVELRVNVTTQLTGLFCGRRTFVTTMFTASLEHAKNSALFSFSEYKNYFPFDRRRLRNSSVAAPQQHKNTLEPKRWKAFSEWNISASNTNKTKI